MIINWTIVEHNTSVNGKHFMKAHRDTEDVSKKASVTFREIKVPREIWLQYMYVMYEMSFIKLMILFTTSIRRAKLFL